MTTGLNVVNALARSTQHTLMLPGGTLRAESMSIGGRGIETALAGMIFDTAYLAADSIDPDLGLSTFREDEAHLNAAMAAASRRLIILADSSKFRAPALHNFHEIENIHAIVTDSGATDAIVQRIEARGTAVHRVEVKETP
jgi:DeoR family galactitol utilization operon repressor